MAMMFPSKEELNQLFGFVSDEDRRRWGDKGASAGTKKQQSMFSEMGRSLQNAAQMRHQREQMAEARASSQKRPQTRVRETVTERTTVEDDYVR